MHLQYCVIMTFLVFSAVNPLDPIHRNACLVLDIVINGSYSCTNSYRCKYGTAWVIIKECKSLNIDTPDSKSANTSNRVVNIRYSFAAMFLGNYRIAGIFRGGRFGCITVIICGLNFCAAVVPRKIYPFAKTKDLPGNGSCSPGIVLEQRHIPL